MAATCLLPALLPAGSRSRGAPCGSADRATPCRQDGDAEAPGKTLVGRRCLAGTAILYASLDTPLYSGRSLESMVRLFMDAHDHGSDRQLWILFDEVQYHKGWEVHLKSLVDSYPRIRFIASGSAAAALRMKSRESGAVRFTEFLLPPLTFAEYLNFAGREEELIVQRQFPWIPARRSRASRSRSSGPMPLSDRARSYVV